MRAHYASSGSLARRIAAGAPAEVFLSASPEWMDFLAGRGLLLPGSRRAFARNALVCVVPAGAEEKAPENAAALARLRRIALGDPAHVPAGRYARRALEAAGVWGRLAGEGRLVFAPDVRAALAFVERGEVPAGIVYATDARLSKRVREAFRLPEGGPPILYAGGAVAGRAGAAEARVFLDFLGGPEARAVLAEAGFLPPPPEGKGSR